MKTKILITALFLCFGITTMGWCLAINGGSFDGTDVGGLDTYLYSTNTLVNSNPTTETAWVNSVLSPGSVTFQLKQEEALGLPIYDTTLTGVYAVHIMPTPPDSYYFLIKNATWWALFENSDKLDWGVFDSNDLPSGMNISGGNTVSHVTRFGGIPVPEPATMLLLGTGLVGLAGFGRKRFFKK